MDITDWEREELEALALTNSALGGPTFMSRAHWRDYRRLVRRKLVRWGAPPKGFTVKRFAGVEITTLGRLTLSPTPAQGD